MLSKHKQPSLEAGLLVILLVISLFSFGFLSENKVMGMAIVPVTGENSPEKVDKLQFKDGSLKSVTLDSKTWEKEGDAWRSYVSRSVYGDSWEVPSDYTKTRLNAIANKYPDIDNTVSTVTKGTKYEGWTYVSNKDYNGGGYLQSPKDQSWARYSVNDVMTEVGSEVRNVEAIATTTTPTSTTTGTASTASGGGTNTPQQITVGQTQPTTTQTPVGSEPTKTPVVETSQNLVPTVQSLTSSEQSENERLKREADKKAMNLYEAMDGWGTDEEEIFNTLASIKNKEEMDRVEKSFEKKTNGESLDTWLRGDLSGSDETRAFSYINSAKNVQEGTKTTSAKPTTIKTAQEMEDSERKPIPLEDSTPTQAPNPSVTEATPSTQPTSQSTTTPTTTTTPPPTAAPAQPIPASSAATPTTPTTPATTTTQPAAAKPATPPTPTPEETSKANEKALTLYKAMKGLSTDEKTIFTTLESVKNRAEMERVESSFKVMAEGKTLDSRLRGELSGYEETRALYLVSWAKSDKEQRGVEKAGKLIDSIGGKDKTAVKETLKEIGSQQEMNDIEIAFQSMSGGNLEGWISTMSDTDRAEALGYINTNKQKTANNVEYLKNYNINYLGLTRNADGSYSRAGYEGKYYLQEDGTVFYTGGKSPTGTTQSAQTLTKEGKWDTTKKNPLKPIGEIPKPTPTIDQSGNEFIVKNAEGKAVYKGKDADKAYEEYQKLMGTTAKKEGEPSIVKVDGNWIVKDAMGNEVYRGTDPNIAFAERSKLTAAAKGTKPTTITFNYNKDEAQKTEVKDVGEIKLTIKENEAVDEWGNAYKKVEGRWEVTKTNTEPEAPTLKSTSNEDISVFLTQMSIYSEQLVLYGKDKKTQQEVKEHIDIVKNKAKEYTNKPTTENRKQFEAAVQVLNNKLVEVKAQGGSTSEQTFNLLYGNDIEVRVAKEYFKQNADDPEIMKKLATGGYNEDEWYVMSSLIIEIALEKGRDSEAYKQAGDQEKRLIDIYLPKKELADNLRKAGKDIYYDWEKDEFYTKDKHIIIKDTIKGTGTDWTSYNFKVSDILLDRVQKTGPERYFPDKIIKNIQEYAQSNGIILDQAKFAEGKIVDIQGNSYSWGYDMNGKAVINIESKRPPSEITLNGRTQKLTEIKDYKADGNKALYQTEDGTIFSIDAVWTDAGNHVFNGKISKIETIGDEKDPNNVKIRNYFYVENGKKKSNVVSVSIVNKNDQKIENDIPIDSETLSMITKTIGAKGIVTSSKSDLEGAEIKFTNKDGQDTTIIRYSKDYKIEANKLTGIKSQTDFEYKAIDKNGDGQIDDEEKANSVQFTTRFTATQEEKGKVNKMWYADDFKFGNDGIYFADMYMQAYDIKTGKPEGDQIYYYIEGGNKGDENAGLINIKLNDKGEPTTDDADRKIIKIVNGEAIDTKTGQPISNTEEGQRAIKRASQASSRRWFSNFEFKLTQYKGLSGWSQLIFSKEELAKWREGVDKIFSSLYLGTDYWTSAICSKYIPKQQTGTFTMQTKDGLFDVVAHVEGEKTSIPAPEGAQYLYKLTFSIRNPKYSQYDKLKFNVYLHGDKTVQLYPQDIGVDDGDSFARGTGQVNNGQATYDQQHGKPVVKYSIYNYNKICIRFNPGIVNAKGRIENEVCNAIVEHKGSATKYEKKVTASGALTPTAASEPYQEADF